MPFVLRLKRRGLGEVQDTSLLLQEIVFVAWMWVTRCYEGVQRPMRVRFCVALLNSMFDVHFILLVVYNNSDVPSILKLGGSHLCTWPVHWRGLT